MSIHGKSRGYMLRESQEKSLIQVGLFYIYKLLPISDTSEEKKSKVTKTASRHFTMLLNFLLLLFQKHSLPKKNIPTYHQYFLFRNLAGPEN